MTNFKTALVGAGSLTGIEVVEAIPSTGDGGAIDIAKIAIQVVIGIVTLIKMLRPKKS